MSLFCNKDLSDFADGLRHYIAHEWQFNKKIKL